ncbi:MAG: anthranilate synthase component I family protein [SAR116 cluster bacterium]|nr:MAG: anthranilate synthase component I family protein [SAR116 cluster bacterium]
MTMTNIQDQPRLTVRHNILPGDLHTPVGLVLRFQEDQGDLFLFESVVGGANKGRYSVLARCPDRVLEITEDQVTLTNGSGQSLPCAADGLEALRDLWAQLPSSLPKDVPPMALGIYGAMSFEAVSLLEPKLKFSLPTKDDIPLGRFVRPTQILILDHARDELHLVQLIDELHADEATKELEKTLAILEQPVPAMKHGTPKPADPTITSNLSQEQFEMMVEKAQKYIAAGDVFQVVPSQRFSRAFHLGGVALYRALRTTNPSPYMFYVRNGGLEFVGSSPEILVRVSDRHVTLRPIAGTRPRGLDAAKDLELAQELQADPKECAEHLMLLDLGRNDVGRVSDIGSVQVEEEFVIERYSHVMHMVSQVGGTLAEGNDAIDALLAGLPAGTVSGAPKLRALEIIAELEPGRRGIYAGGIGYLGLSGNMDTCLVLRTAVVEDGIMHVQAGAGVVYDSVPHKEYEETVNKARALFHAAEVAEERFGGRS